MFRRLKGILITIILILSSLIVCLNPGVGTGNNENISHDMSNTQGLHRTNGEINWSEIEVLSEPVPGHNLNTASSFDPKIAVESGNIYVVWEDQNDTANSSSDRDIFYRYYNGNQWSEIQVISEPVPGQNFNTAWSLNPKIVVENGNIYVVWWDANNTNGAGTDNDIFYRCNLSNSGWGPIDVISEPQFGNNINSGTSLYPEIAVDKGKIYVVWEDRTGFNGSGSDMDIFYRTNLTGSGWENIQVISEPVNNVNFNTENSDLPAIAVENGKIYVVWQDENDTNGAGPDRDIFYRCDLTGLGWNPVQVISEPIIGSNTNKQGSQVPNIAVENGKIHVVWNDHNNTNGAGIDPDIFYRYFDGASWTNVQVISEPSFGNNFNSGTSWMADLAAENDNVYVVWHDENDTKGAGPDYDILYRCKLNGSNWGNIDVLSETATGMNSNTEDSYDPAIAVDNNEIHIVWEDSNNTNGAGPDDDIFYRGISSPLSLLFPIVTPTSGNTSTYFNFTVQYLHLENIAPAKITVNISGTEYPLLEVDPTDLNYKDGKDYFFNITHLDIRVHKYRFFTSDGKLNRLTILISKPIVYNTAPNITTQDITTTFEDEYYEVVYSYKDIDLTSIGQFATWNLSTNASWLNFNNVTAILNGTPTNDDVGNYWINISINDTMDIDFTNFTLTVINENDNPIIETNNIEITYEDELYEVDYNASDIDSLIPNQIWSLDTNATSWLDIDTTTGIISGTPANDDVGEYWVNVSVDDGETGSDFINFTLIVFNVNDPPEIVTSNILTTKTGTLYEVDYNATDIDPTNDTLTWSLSTNASWLGIDTVLGRLNGTPKFNDAGWYNVNVTVDDGNSGLDWTEFVLNVVKGVVEDNQPPIITTIDRVTATADVLYEVDYEATDDRTSLDLLTWQLNTDAIWLSLATSTGVLSGTPIISDVGAYWVNVTVGDGEGGFDSHNFTLTVYSEANNPPEITTEDVINAVVGELYSVDYEADDDRTPVVNLQWSLKTNASNWLGIDKGTGILSGVPELEDVGSYWVEVTVFDGEDGWDFTNFTLYITTEPITDFKPELNNPSVTPTIGNTETLFIFSVEYSHPKGDPPDSIQVVIDDIAYDLIYNTSSDSYEYRMKLNEGAYTYYFTTTLGEHIIQTEAASIIVRRAPGIQPDDGDEDGGEEYNTLIYAIIGIIVIIIVVLILLFIFLKKKKKEEQQVGEAQSQQPRPIQMPLVFQPPAQQQYQYQQSLPPFPMVTPQVPQSQIEPTSPEPIPIPQVEEEPVPQIQDKSQLATEEE